MFCSPRCTKDYSAQRLSLLREIEYIDHQLTQVSSIHSNIATQLRRQRAHAAWHLARFGGEPSDTNT